MTCSPLLFLLSTLFIIRRAQSASPSSPGGYVLREEAVVYQRWRTITQRLVDMPNGRTVHFDVVGNINAQSAVLILAWNTTSKTCTILREYNPGCHQVLYGLAAGLVEDDKHGANATLAAHHELEEECHLGGGTWYSLTPERPLPMDKYATTTAHCFLVLDPVHVENPRPLDDEEDIEIIRGVSAEKLRDMITRGEFNVIGAWAALLALQKLRELGEIY